MADPKPPGAPKKQKPVQIPKSDGELPEMIAAIPEPAMPQLRKGAADPLRAPLRKAGDVGRKAKGEELRAGSYEELRRGVYELLKDRLDVKTMQEIDRLLKDGSSPPPVPAPPRKPEPPRADETSASLEPAVQEVEPGGPVDGGVMDYLIRERGLRGMA
jgi:hypothetical protein